MWIKILVIFILETFLLTGTPMVVVFDLLPAKTSVPFTHAPESHGCKGVDESRTFQKVRDEWLSVRGFAPRRKPVHKGATAVKPWDSTIFTLRKIAIVQGVSRQHKKTLYLPDSLIRLAELIASGKSIKETSKILDCSVNTILYANLYLPLLRNVIGMQGIGWETLSKILKDCEFLSRPNTMSYEETRAQGTRILREYIWNRTGGCLYLPQPVADVAVLLKKDLTYGEIAKRLSGKEKRHITKKSIEAYATGISKVLGLSYARRSVLVRLLQLQEVEIEVILVGAREFLLERGPGYYQGARSKVLISTAGAPLYVPRTLAGVMEGIVEGKTNTEIAAELGIPLFYVDFWAVPLLNQLAPPEISSPDMARRWLKDTAIQKGWYISDRSLIKLTELIAPLLNALAYGASRTRCILPNVVKQLLMPVVKDRMDKRHRGRKRKGAPYDRMVYPLVMRRLIEDDNLEEGSALALLRFMSYEKLTVLSFLITDECEGEELIKKIAEETHLELDTVRKYVYEIVEIVYIARLKRQLGLYKKDWIAILELEDVEEESSNVIIDEWKREIRKKINRFADTDTCTPKTFSPSEEDKIGISVTLWSLLELSPRNVTGWVLAGGNGVAFRIQELILLELLSKGYSREELLAILNIPSRDDFKYDMSRLIYSHIEGIERGRGGNVFYGNVLKALEQLRERENLIPRELSNNWGYLGEGLRHVRARAQFTDKQILLLKRAYSHARRSNGAIGKDKLSDEVLLTEPQIYALCKGKAVNMRFYWTNIYKILNVSATPGRGRLEARAEVLNLARDAGIVGRHRNTAVRNPLPIISRGLIVFLLRDFLDFVVPDTFEERKAYLIRAHGMVPIQAELLAASELTLSQLRRMDRKSFMEYLDSIRDPTQRQEIVEVL